MIHHQTIQRKIIHHQTIDRKIIHHQTIHRKVKPFIIGTGELK